VAGADEDEAEGRPSPREPGRTERPQPLVLHRLEPAEAVLRVYVCARARAWAHETVEEKRRGVPGRQAGKGHHKPWS
jgi:hypothetical protein